MAGSRKRGRPDTPPKHSAGSSKRKTPLAQLRAAWASASPAERQQFIAEITGGADLLRS